MCTRYVIEHERLVGKPPVCHRLACPRCSGLYSFFLCRRTRCTAESPFGKRNMPQSRVTCYSCYNVLLLAEFICKCVLINNSISRVFYWFLPYHRIDKNSFQLMLWGRNIVTWIGERKLWRWARTSSMHQCRTIPTPPILRTGVSVLFYEDKFTIIKIRRPLCDLKLDLQ